MGSLGTLFAATLVAVTYGWMPASSDDQGEPVSASNGYEYLVQIRAEDLQALAEGRVSSLSSATPEGMKSIDRVRIVFGEGDLPRQLTAVDRTSPRRISQTAVKHEVAKPIVSDWLPDRTKEPSTEGPSDETGQRHTVYQRPGYQNPGSLGEAMQRGFQEGTRRLTDSVRNAPQNLGNYTNQAARDLAQETQNLVGGALNDLRGANNGLSGTNNGVNLSRNDPNFNQRQQGQTPANGTGAGARQPGFKAYSYNNQPTLAGRTNSQDNHAGHDHSGHDHAGHDHAGHDHQLNTSLDRSTVDNRNQGPSLPSARGRTAADDSIATPFGSGADVNRDYRRSGVDQGYDANRDADRTNLRDYDRRNDDRRNDSGTNDYRQQFVDRRDEGRMTPVARDTTRLGPLDEFDNRRDDPYRNPSRSGSLDRGFQ